jgi:chitosanase
MRPFLDDLACNATTTLDPNNPPTWCKDFMGLLSKAGKEDPIMIQAQEESIDTVYFNPAEAESISLGLAHSLSYAVVFDSYIHSGGISKTRRLFSEVPPIRGGDEKEWTQAYVRARRAWLANFPNTAVMKTVYRMDAFLDLIKRDNWELKTPFVVRGQTIT